jgi:uncharacterized protein YacL
MLLHVLRGLFILLMAAVGWFYLQLTWLSVAIALSLGILFVCIDVLSPRKKIAVFSGVLLGLVVGLAVAYALHFAVALIVEQLSHLGIGPQIEKTQGAYVQFISLIVGLISCYLSISFTLQTKDDFRFIIPYVEFSRKAKGERPMLLDTSVLIDGRIADIINTGFIQCQLVVPRFVLNELQAVADSGDKLKRNRGRRGLEIMSKLRNNSKVDVVMYDGSTPDVEADAPVDQRLLALATELGGRVLTNDHNLNRVAELRGVEVVNLNDLGNAVKPVVLPGEKMRVRLVKPGESVGQGVGYLDDGTMVVVEQGRAYLNQEVDLTVTSALQTSAGRMIFGRLGDAGEKATEEAPPRGRAQNPKPQPL